jgi:hypothetical protein
MNTGGMVYAVKGVARLTAHLTIRCSLLDEDTSSLEGAGDEIYAKITFEAPGCSRMTKKTNTVHGRY